MSGAGDVVEDCARLREAPVGTYTIPQAIEDALWLERTPDAVLAPAKARQIVATLHAALQANPAVYKGARYGIPLFALLAYDRAGHVAITAWSNAAEEHGCRPEKVEDARRILSRWAARSDLAWPT